MRTPTQTIWLLLMAIACGGGKSSDTANTALDACIESERPTLAWDGETLKTDDHACGSVALTARVIGDGEWAVSFSETARGTWQPSITTSTGGVLNGLVLEGTWELLGETEAVLWKQGYQSWSWSGVTSPGTATFDDEGVITTDGDGDGTDVAFENDTTSWWAGLIGRADGASLLLGAESAFTTRFFMGIDGENVQAVWGHRGEAISMAAGETRALDPLWLGLAADAQELWASYGDSAAEVAPPRGLDQQPPTGWATWYQYYSEVNEDDVRENLEALISLQKDPSLSPVEVFQIDDGWQERWGDWWAGDDFPSGMTQLAEDIAEAGMTPGLWMAPLYMSTESETYSDNPDWWVLDDTGAPIQFSNLNTGDYVILDVTHPDAAVWLRDLITEKVGQGYDYLKLDFLYAGAMPGQRYEDVTAMEAYHVGMNIMREAAGDAWILACGAPFLPSLGYAESFRTGADIAFEISPDPDMAYYRWQARSSAARGWTQGRWWWMDPDQLIVREPLTDTEVRGALASALVAGGTWMLGDDLVALDTDRLNLMLQSDVLTLLGQQVSPTSPLDHVSGVDPSPIFEAANPNDQSPTYWTLADGTTVLLNLGTTAIELDGPGGTNLLTGESASAGVRMLQPGDGEIWVP